MSSEKNPYDPKECPPLDVNIDQPRYDQSTYIGRARHFFQTTNPLNIFASEDTLDKAKCIITKYRCKEPLPVCLTEDELWEQKVLYDSAFHPDTGEKMMILGRMSAQVPSNMLITGGMMSFYKSTPAVIFWQWINQSFNALVNFTNRSGDAKISNNQIKMSYVLATGGALVTALSLNRMVKNLPPIVGRCVPFAAVAAANCVNIPLMRSQELKDGTPVFDENNNRLGNSKAAAQSGIAQVTLSRIIMAMPGMLIAPFIMNHLERRGTLCRYPWITMPLQVALVGVCLTFATPLACALFEQQASLPYAKLDPELREKLDKKYNNNPPKYVFFNKGL